MSVRVNLLPRASKEGAKATRQRVAAGSLVLAVLIALGAASLWQRSVLSDAEEELEIARAELAAASADVRALSPYAALANQLDADRELIVGALSWQATLAGVLQDLALIMPDGTDFRSLTINFTPGEPADDGLPETVGTLQASGESLELIAPGIERLLLQLERVAGFQEVFVSQVNIDEEDVVSYSIDLQLGREHLTGRFLEGIPEVGR